MMTSVLVTEHVWLSIHLQGVFSILLQRVPSKVTS